MSPLIHRRTCGLVAALMCGVAAAQAQPSTESAIDTADGRLNRAATYFLAQRFHPFGREIIKKTSASQRESFQVFLVAGVSNIVLAACSGDCGSLRAAVVDDQRDASLTAGEMTGMVAINVNPTRSGLHRLDVDLPKCRQECEIGLIVLRQPPSQQTARAADFRSYQNRDLDGGDIAKLRDVGAENECADACRRNAQCRAYSFDKWNRYCFLKSSVSALRLDPRSITGVRGDLPAPPAASAAIRMERHRGRSFPDTGYRTVAAGQLETCEATCRNEESCVAYTFRKAGGLCRLYAVADEYMPDAGSDSGAKVQEPASP